ncbi:hypothetical protein Tco_0168734 [Tanacetum coccineum]
MKDIGEADVILVINIKCESKGIVITQSHYIEKILKKFNREDCSPVNTLMDLVKKLKLNTRKPVHQLEYSRAIGCLMYAMTSTRLDIAYAVGRFSTKDYGLSYVGYPSVLEGYSDASWINHVEDSSSTSGWVFLLGEGAISWASKKQTCITGSTMESEFVALAAAGKEAEWLRNLIHEIPIWPKPIAPISIRCDSAPTMARAYSQIYNGKSRHLAVSWSSSMVTVVLVASVCAGRRGLLNSPMFYVPRVEMVINPPWEQTLSGSQGLASPEQTATVENGFSPPWIIPFLGANGLTSPRVNATCKGSSPISL